MKENEIGEIVIAAGIQVHRVLGPGLLESVYETVLAFELQQRGLEVRRQVPIPIRYEHLVFDEGFRADLIVNDRVIIELKSVVQLTSAHRKQLQTHLRLSGRRLGYLFNFGEALLRDVWGIDAEVTTRTVDTHVKRLREKLGAAEAYIETLRGVGYRFAGTEGGEA